MRMPTAGGDWSDFRPGRGPKSGSLASDGLGVARMPGDDLCAQNGPFSRLEQKGFGFGGRLDLIDHYRKCRSRGQLPAWAEFERSKSRWRRPNLSPAENQEPIPQAKAEPPCQVPSAVAITSSEIATQQ